MSMALGRNSAIDAEKIAADLARIDEVSERVRLANYGLAVPLVQMRERQMEREVARVAARRGADDPEVAVRTAALGRARQRFDLFRAELARTRIEPPEVKGEGAAGIWGRVVRGQEPVTDASVVAYAAGARNTFACTSRTGGFSMEVPAGTEITLSVVLKEGGEAFRDRTGVVLKPGQTLSREIDLAAVMPPCKEPPPDKEPPKDDTFPMVQLVGQFERDAQRLISAQRLVLGDRSEKIDVEQAGRVIDQKPAAGATVRAGDAVAIVVATNNDVNVPSVLGLAREDAEVTILKAELKLGKIAEISVSPDQAGRVLNQKPVAGARVPRGSEVALEVGIRSRIAPERQPEPKLARIVDLAASRLGEGGRGSETPAGTLPKRLADARIMRVADLDKLLARDRAQVRDQLGLSTLAETDRTIAALKKARKDLGD
jgi:hypothetical protein